MKRRSLVRVTYLILIAFFALSLSAWVGQPDIGPTANVGSWSGVTSRGHPVSFFTTSGNQVISFSLKTDFNLGFCSGTITQNVISPMNIVNNQFSATSGSFSVTGRFTTNSTATGTYSYTNQFLAGCGAFFSQSGTWTAQGPASVPTPIPTIPTQPPPSTFADVPASYWAHDFVERLYDAGITGGCGSNPLTYCPEGTVTRAQMAIFLLRGIHGSNYVPPTVGSSTGFSDVPPTYWAAAWIKQLAAEGVTGGCGTGTYCPEGAVTRAQMAIFLLRSKHGSSYVPPAVGSSTGFGDVPPTYWAAAWIKQLVAEGITTGCSAGSYCPESPVTRAQMAVFLVRTFNLP